MLDFVMRVAIQQRLACGESLQARIGGGVLDEIKFVPAAVVKRNCQHYPNGVVRSGNKYEGALKARWPGFFWRKFVNGARGGSLLCAYIYQAGECVSERRMNDRRQ